MGIPREGGGEKGFAGMGNPRGDPPGEPALLSADAGLLIFLDSPRRVSPVWVSPGGEGFRRYGYPPGGSPPGEYRRYVYPPSIFLRRVSPAWVSPVWEYR